MEDLSPEISSLQEALEAEFCPPLDSTIVALLVVDHLSGKKPDEEILKTLRDQLAVLASSAAADQDDQLAKDFHDLQLSGTSVTTEDSATRDADSVFSQTAPSASSSSTSSTSPSGEMASSTQPDTALAFLRASFPHLPPKSLRTRLKASDFDMERIVEDLLSEEYVRELEERGLEDESLDEEIEQWTVVSRRKPTASFNRAPSILTISNKKRKARRKTIVINDIRQQQHVRKESQIRSSGDPWNQVASLSSYLESLLGWSSSYFQSYFHTPHYSTPAEALRAALKSLENPRDNQSTSEDGKSALLSLMEFIRASPDFDFDRLDSEARERLYEDAELSLVTAGGSPDVALDLVKLLHELEMDGESGQEMGVYHSPAYSLPASSTLSQSTLTTKVAPISAVSTPISSTSSRVTIPAVPPSVAPRQRPPPAPSKNAWQTVSPARPKPPDIHPLAAHIPSYNPLNVPRRKPRAPIHKTGPGNVNGSAGRGKAVLGSYKSRIEACHSRRDEALRTASRHWNSGGARNRGGEVALFYAQEAQRHQAEVQKLQLDAMRELVDGKRFAGADTDVIDIHYCTTSEALTIVREVLDEGWVSPARQLRVITGRGSHSSNGVAVLGPAVKKALEGEGWNVGKWDGGLSIRGRTR
ncbi:hypothetical protein ACEPAH_3611 [Sanghuangporus vaninii]